MLQFPPQLDKNHRKDKPNFSKNKSKKARRQITKLLLITYYKKAANSDVRPCSILSNILQNPNLVFPERPHVVPGGCRRPRPRPRPRSLPLGISPGGLGPGADAGGHGGPAGNAHGCGPASNYAIKCIINWGELRNESAQEKMCLKIS